MSDDLYWIKSKTEIRSRAAHMIYIETFGTFLLFSPPKSRCAYSERTEYNDRDEELLTDPERVFLPLDGDLCGDLFCEISL